MATIAPDQRGLSCDEALKIAREDAEKAYGDLAGYRIQVLLEADGWHIGYELARPMMAGGGPHYVIDRTDGTFISKRYEQ